jgi:hypothetical protein
MDRIDHHVRASKFQTSRMDRQFALYELTAAVDASPAP